jgi:hypothetical protein
MVPSPRAVLLIVVPVSAVCSAAAQVAVLLAPVAFVTHVDSVPLLTLAQFNTDQVRSWHELGFKAALAACADFAEQYFHHEVCVDVLCSTRTLATAPWQCTRPAVMRLFIMAHTC